MEKNLCSCCGAGTSADTIRVSAYVSANMELMRMNTNRKFLPVAAAAQFTKQYLHRYNGRIKAHLILGGIDSGGPHIYNIHPYGSTDRVPYATMGSGSLAAMSVLESRWKPDLDEEQGMKLVRDAVSAGIFNDLGSGSNVNIAIIKNYYKVIRGYDVTAKKGDRKGEYNYKRGTTGVLSCKTFDIDIVEEEISKLDSDY